MERLLTLVHVQRDEVRRVAALWALGIVYYASTSLGDNVAQAVFSARVGARALASIIIWKGAFDVLAAAAYLPLTRGRSPRRVLAAALAIYAATLLGARLALAGAGHAPAYVLYLGNECAGTILTIHWGVYVLDRFDAARARRLFPVIFTATRLGAIAAGVALAHLARPLGAANLLLGAAGVALAGAAMTTTRAARTPGHVHADAPSAESELVDDTGEDGPVARLFRSWRQAWASPLVRAIAASTAAMVLLRYGLKILALDAIDRHYGGDEDHIAHFLGSYASWANLAAIAIGLGVTPRLIARFGLGAANATYALLVLGVYGWLLGRPSLGAAVGARFVDVELKDTLKTPLSALFYGAEPRERRAPARAFVFGAVNPAATALSSGLFQVTTQLWGVAVLVWTGLPVAVAFVGTSLWQNRAYRRRHVALLAVELERWPAARPLRPPPPAITAMRAGGERALAAQLAWRGLHAEDASVRAVAGEVLADTLPRRAARAVIEALASPGPSR